MKKRFPVIIILMLCICLSACSGEKSDEAEKKESGVEAQDKATTEVLSEKQDEGQEKATEVLSEKQDEGQENVQKEDEKAAVKEDDLVDSLKQAAADILLGNTPMKYYDETKYWTDVTNYDSLATSVLASLMDIEMERSRTTEKTMEDMYYSIIMSSDGVVIYKNGEKVGAEDELADTLAEYLGDGFFTSLKKKDLELPDYLIKTDCSGDDFSQWVIRLVDPKSLREDKDNSADANDEKNTDMGENEDMTDIKGFASGISAAENQEGTDPEAVASATVTDVEIEIDCPASAYEKREGTDYSDFVHFTYYSETCGMDRGANVLLPAGYSEDKKYPVLYMLHGIFGDENSFKNDSNMKTIWANMAADCVTDEMIVVFPNMYAKTEPGQAPAFTAEACLPYDNFVNDLVNDLMPYMEANYSILTGRENTAVAGFSMGGRETLYIALLKPELFGYACAISPAPGLVPGADMFMTHPGSMTEEEVRYADGVVQPEILILCGTKDSVVGTFPKEYHELMEKNGVAHTWYEVPGADHDNRTIISGIYNFLHRVFR